MPEIGPKYTCNDAITFFTQTFDLVSYPHMQDWEIEAADSHKLAAFIAFFKTELATMDINKKFTLMSLILYSLDDYLGEICCNKLRHLHEFDQMWTEVRALFKDETAVYFHVLGYLYCYGAQTYDEMFHISPFIRGLDFSPELMQMMAEEYGRDEETPDVPDSGAARERA